MFSLSCTIVLLSVLIHTSWSTRPDSHVQSDDPGDSVSSIRKQFAETDTDNTWREQTGTDGYSRVLNAGSILQTAFSRSGHRQLDKSRKSDLEYEAGADGYNTDINSRHRMTKKGESINISQESSRMQNTNNNNFGKKETVSTEKKDKGNNDKQHTVHFGQASRSYQSMLHENTDIYSRNLSNTEKQQTVHFGQASRSYQSMLHENKDIYSRNLSNKEKTRSSSNTQENAEFGFLFHLAKSSSQFANVTSASKFSTANVTGVNNSSNADVTNVKSSTNADVTNVKNSTNADVTDVSSSTNADVTSVSSSTNADVTSVSSSTNADVTSVSRSTNTDVTSVSSSTNADVTSVSSSTNADVTSVKRSTNADVTSVSSSTNADVTNVSTSSTPNVTRVKSPSTDEAYSCCNISNGTVNCIGCHLTFVPSDLPTDIRHLLLSDNDISSYALYPGVFVNYTNLVELNLASNNITVFQDDVFQGLHNLKTLSLHNNSIILNMELNLSKVFYPLNSTLEVLIMNRNTKPIKNKSLVYPDHALSVLKELSHLHIDGLTNTQFGFGFSKLTKLTHLSMAGFHDGYCNITSLSNTTFLHLTHLTFLNISDCNLIGYNTQVTAFNHLSKLQILDVSNNFDLGLIGVEKFMHGLRNNTNFVHLKMQRIVPRFAPCIIVFDHMLINFRHTGLQVIEAMDNEIEMIETGALQRLPPTLKEVNLTNNRIMFGAYWKDMASLTELKELHLDGFTNPVKFPLFFPTSQLHCPEWKVQNYTVNSNNGKKYGENCTCGPGTCVPGKEQFFLPLPPKLQNFTMHSNSLSYKINNINFCPQNILSSVDLSDNIFQELEGPITGLTHIKQLVLSSCFIEHISDHFFDNLTSLEHLNLFQNLLGDCLINDEDGAIFEKLRNLKYLNLSFNNLYKLNWLAFKNLNNLEILDLSTNRLSNVNLSVDHMTKIKFLDLHKNDISSLPKPLMELVDSLLKAKPNSVTIDLSRNPINCDCTNLEFLEWVIDKQVFGTNYSYYYCKYPLVNYNSVEMKFGYKEEVEQLRRMCSSNVYLFVGVAACTLLLVVFIIGVLLYRFRWTLRYWFHAAKLKIYANPHQVNKEYAYDVFVSYASDDVDFVLKEITPHLSAERHLKLLIHGETFQAGRHITDNIYMAVCDCRKTLVLVTRNMLNSHWCTYELQMARMESVSTGRNILVFLFLGEIPANLISIEVMAYIKTSTYIMFPKEVQYRQAFWDKLADDLRAP